MSRGLLVAFSGVDGAGKSTQIDRLLVHLRQEGQHPMHLWTRGGYTPLFEGLKALVRRVGGRSMPQPGKSPQRTQAFGRGWVRRLWLALALLDLLWLYGIQVRWWLWRGRTVVCDRFLGDTLVDFRLHYAQETVERWWLWRLLVRVTPAPRPAFLLLVPVEESVRRSNQKGEPFPDPPEVLARRLAQYEALARDGRWQVLDGRRPIAELAAEVVGALQQVSVVSSGGEPNPPTPFPTREGGVVDEGGSTRKEGVVIDGEDTAALVAAPRPSSVREGGPIIDSNFPFPRRDGGRGARSVGG